MKPTQSMLLLLSRNVMLTRRQEAVKYENGLHDFTINNYYETAKKKLLNTNLPVRLTSAAKGGTDNPPATSIEILEIKLDRNREWHLGPARTDEQVAEQACIVGEHVVNKLNQDGDSIPFPGAFFRVEPINGTDKARLSLDWSPNAQTLLAAVEPKEPNKKGGGCTIS